MLSNLDVPKNYMELSRKITQSKPKKFTVIEVLDPSSKTLMNKQFNEFLRKGPFSVIFVGD